MRIVKPLDEIQDEAGRSPASGRMPGRKLLGNGKLALTEKQIAFAEWLANPDKEKGTLAAFAATIGVAPCTLSKWKKDDDVIAEWERQLRARNISPDRVQRVIDSLYDAAASGDVKAAMAWLQVVDKFTPKKKIEVERGAEDLDDDELADALEAQLAALRKRA